MSRLLGKWGMKLGSAQTNVLPSSLKFTSFIHSVGPRESEKPVETAGFDAASRILGPVDTGRNGGFFEGMGRRLTAGRPFWRDTGSAEAGRPMRGFRRDDPMGGAYGSRVEQNADIVHIKIMRNNTFVTVTDSKGNKKTGASAGCLAEMKGGPKVSKYSAEATAEHVGRVAKSMGLKSVVMKVNGYTFFKKKKQAILSFRDGYTHSRSDQNPIVYIEDTTRKPHNGCRLRKQRRV